MPRQCKGKIETGYKTPENNKHSPLTLKNLTGAFIVILIGLSLSILAFICEKIIWMSERHRRRRTLRQLSK
jgi:hypothetical protein